MARTSQSVSNLIINTDNKFPQNNTTPFILILSLPILLNFYYKVIHPTMLAPPTHLQFLWALPVLLLPPATPMEFLEHGQLHHGDNYEAVIIPAEMEARPMHKSELTFSLPDGEQTCFTDDFTDSSNYTFQYKVLGEGQVVDATLVSPHGVQLYTGVQSKGESVTFLSYPGMFTICINNQFYSFTDKTVYLRLQRTSALSMGIIHGDRSPMMLGSKEASTQIIFESLEKVRLHQITYRLKERISSKNAEYLHEKVKFLSTFNGIALILTGLVQTYFLKRLFRENTNKI